MAEALRAADPSAAHLGLAANPQPLGGGAAPVAAAAARPAYIGAARAAGVDLTDKERKALRKQWRIAKNERRKAKSAVKRAAKQVGKAAHHQVRRTTPAPRSASAVVSHGCRLLRNRRAQAAAQTAMGICGATAAFKCGRSLKRRSHPAAKFPAERKFAWTHVIAS